MACVTAQEYSSTMFVLCFHSRKEKFGTYYKNVITAIYFLLFKTVAFLKFQDFNCVSWGASALSAFKEVFIFFLK
jgi:hypothetical protein